MDNEQKQPQGVEPASDSRYYSFAMRIVGDFGFTIAVPAVIATFLGVWIDQQLATAPWAMIGCLALAFVLTGYIVSRKAKKYAEDFEKLN